MIDTRDYQKHPSVVYLYKNKNVHTITTLCMVASSETILLYCTLLPTFFFFIVLPSGGFILHQITALKWQHALPAQWNTINLRRHRYCRTSNKGAVLSCSSERKKHHSYKRKKEIFIQAMCFTLQLSFNQPWEVLKIVFTKSKMHGYKKTWNEEDGTS